MYKRFTPILVVGLLSGCTLTSGEKYHQDTLQAIQNSESSIANRMYNLELQLSNQTDYIESLENEIIDMNNDLNDTIIALSPPNNDDDIDVALEPEPITTEANNEPLHTPSETIILGSVETIEIDSVKQTFKARIDTGSALSSLNAVDIEEFERNGKQWVRFHLSGTSDAQTDSKWIEAPVSRYVKIRQPTAGTVERRIVVDLRVKVGQIHEKTQFTLADRSQMSHSILLGREFIKDIALVDVSQEFIHTENKD
ncbi:ATP-dependent Zn protease [Vibrio sp. 10N.286.49.B3]|uniref:ATP-dependent zinc protease family protein n=1 Tax=Vibrio sp. 10N.286.49.B3 TaxID=1880855 RepID=UPI000C84A69E|nr:ATP-dependent zinc protease [Vibrio sp. 10N.286.49.B3]PMH44951.1 ATP-dependent Zn protease [Vibrio sp. 10N.286.49.B3]